MDHEGNYVVNAGNNYLLSHFELGLLPKEGVVGYTEEELLLMCYNYDISKYSFALAARQEYLGSIECRGMRRRCVLLDMGRLILL